jgi:hypothetical protein
MSGSLGQMILASLLNASRAIHNFNFIVFLHGSDRVELNAWDGASFFIIQAPPCSCTGFIGNCLLNHTYQSYYLAVVAYRRKFAKCQLTGRKPSFFGGD